MKPLFSVGEEIIIQSKNYPEYNNKEDVVVEIIDTGIISFPSTWEELITGTLVIVVSRYAYLLQNHTERRGNVSKEVKIRTWSERSLRKKHKPSGDSFESMMDKIKSPQKLSEKTS